jgi:hypothetical protein
VTDEERQKLCAWLREHAGHEYDDAADEIELLVQQVQFSKLAQRRLQEENERLKAALEPYAREIGRALRQAVP